MTDSPWSKRGDSEPDATNDAGSSATDGGAGGPSAGSSLPADRRPLGPPSSSLPNVPDITPVAGTPLPPSPPAPPADGTVVMPATAVPPPTAPSSGPSSVPGDSAAAGPRYVVADQVPWYRTPDGRTRAGMGLGVAILAVVAGIVWWVSGGGDDSSTLVSDGSTTTVPGQFGTGLDAPTTTGLAVAPVESSTTVPESTTTDSTTSVPTTTIATTTTVPETTTTTASTTTTSTTTTSTSTTSTSTTSTTTTTVPPLPEVVVPGSTSTIGEIVQASPGLSSLDALMSSVGFYAELNAITEPFTLFAPSNAAIAAVQGDLPADPEVVRQLLRRHVTVDGRLGSREIFERSELTMLDGSTVTVDGAAQTVGGAKIVVADKGGADTDQIVQVVSGIVTA